MRLHAALWIGLFVVLVLVTVATSQHYPHGTSSQRNAKGTAQNHGAQNNDIKGGVRRQDGLSEPVNDKDRRASTAAYLEELNKAYGAIDAHFVTAQTTTGDIRMPDDATRRRLQELLASLVGACEKDLNAMNEVARAAGRSEADLRFRTCCWVILAALESERYLDQIAAFVATYSGKAEILPLIYALAQAHPMRDTPTWYVPEVAVLVYPIGPIKSLLVTQYLLGISDNSAYPPRVRAAGIAALSQSLQLDTVSNTFMRLAAMAPEERLRADVIRIMGDSGRVLSGQTRDAVTNCLVGRLVGEQDELTRFICWEALIALRTDRSLSSAFDFADQDGNAIRRCQILSTIALQDTSLPHGSDAIVLQYAGDWLAKASEYLDFAQLAGKITLLLRIEQLTVVSLENFQRRVLALQQGEADVYRRREYSRMLNILSERLGSQQK